MTDQENTPEPTRAPVVGCFALNENNVLGMIGAIQLLGSTKLYLGMSVDELLPWHSLEPTVLSGRVSKKVLMDIACIALDDEEPPLPTGDGGFIVGKGLEGLHIQHVPGPEVLLKFLLDSDPEKFNIAFDSDNATDQLRQLFYPNNPAIIKPPSAEDFKLDEETDER